MRVYFNFTIFFESCTPKICEQIMRFRKAVPFISAIFSVLFLNSCVPDAPHDNPVDPFLNQTQSRKSISGKVYGYYQPYQPLNQVQIYIPQAQYLGYTDADGAFWADDLKDANYQLILSKQGYQSDTVQVDAGDNDLSFFLNAQPRVEILHYYSEKISTIFESEAVLNIEMEIRVNDADGAADVDSAYCSIPAFNMMLPFVKTGQVDSLILRIEQNSVPSLNLRKLVEQPVFILLKDKPGSTQKSGPYYLGRIVEEIALPLTPDNQQTADQPIIFTWKSQDIPFEFSYEIQIFRQQSGLQTMIYNKKNIASTATSSAFNQVLPSGTYFWTLAIRDNLNNMSRSREAVFRVQ